MAGVKMGRTKFNKAIDTIVAAERELAGQASSVVDVLGAYLAVVQAQYERARRMRDALASAAPDWYARVPEAREAQAHTATQVARLDELANTLAHAIVLIEARWPLIARAGNGRGNGSADGSADGSAGEGAGADG